jgi:phosphoglycerate kinase
MIHYIDEVSDLKGKRVLLRLDLNAPVADGKIENSYRLERVIETIDFLRIQQAQTAIIAHCEGADSETLLPMWHFLNGYAPVDFCPTFFTPEAIGKLLDLNDGGVLLFENVRINPGEKENDPVFAQKLAAMADIYVNDAFAVSHREHASIVGVPKLLPHYGGLLLRQEIENLSKAFDPEHPFVFILGGAKFDTKLPLIRKFLPKTEKFFVGGALSNDIFKTKGYGVGTSLVSATDVSALAVDPKVVVPTDVTVAVADGSVSFKKANEVAAGECIMDAGPETISEIKGLLADAKTVVWNGPLGNYEKGFQDKTEQLAEILAEATSRGARTIIGGGDTLAAIGKLGIEDKFSFVSTGGGAMLDFLVNETLPGIEALTE